MHVSGETAGNAAARHFNYVHTLLGAASTRSTHRVEQPRFRHPLNQFVMNAYTETPHNNNLRFSN